MEDHWDIVSKKHHCLATLTQGITWYKEFKTIIHEDGLNQWQEGETIGMGVEEIELSNGSPKSYINWLFSRE